jgi:hypothetical protein
MMLDLASQAFFSFVWLNYKKRGEREKEKKGERRGANANANANAHPRSLTPS